MSYWEDKFNKSLQEKRNSQEKQRIKAIEEGRYNASKNKEYQDSFKKRYSRLSTSNKKKLTDDLLQPFGKTRDKFYQKYGYLPDVHGTPGSLGFEDRVKKDAKGRLGEAPIAGRGKKYF